MDLPSGEFALSPGCPSISIEHVKLCWGQASYDDMYIILVHVIHNFNFVLVDQQENYEIMRKFIILRASLVPYSYSNARTAYDEGINLPMYIRTLME